ncbi:MFS transporter [Arthrobacter sp. Br18]|uniref:MFS transporter n=1 Tax=Arthrobacter sp. Br18 TaxID=1312954 RepID=UPI000684F191|nr:MFS transporter [Arthrobacter sp. Br18]
MPQNYVATEPHETMPLDARRAIRGGIFGNYVDQFDIFLPVVALAPAAAHLFGPENLAGNAGLIFVATLLGRPLGAAIFGPIADRIGRAATTQVALIGIAVTTLLIALVPGHTVLGSGTLLTIVALRFVGGVFLGGEYTSAIPLAMEWSEPKRRGLVSGFIMWMSPWANASIAALVFGLLSVLDEGAYNAWGWRVPFLLGSLLAFGMLGYYRSRVADSPIWKQSTKRANPLKDIFIGEHRRALWQVFLLMSGLWLFTYMAIPTLTSELALDGRLDAKAISFTLMCATAASAVVMAGCGHLSTFTGRRTFFIGFGLVGAVLAPLTFLGVFSAESTSGVVLLVVALQIVTVSGYGPVGAYLVERFPAAVRSSGYGVGYSLSIVLPALYPYYLPPLQDLLGRSAAVAGLLILAGLLVAAGGFIGPKTDTTHQLH